MLIILYKKNVNHGSEKPQTIYITPGATLPHQKNRNKSAR